MGAAEQAVPATRWLALLMLAALFTLGNIDRALVSVLTEPIRREFGLSDSQLGLLTGLAFAIPYALASLPMGRLIDRTNRVRLTAVTGMVWSSLTALTAVLQSFGGMVAARVALGAAEAGMAPALTSLTSDLFPKSRRARAIALLYLSTPFGVLLGFWAGGALGAHFGWRGAFLLAAIPGFILAAIIWLFLREPARGGAEESGVKDIGGIGAILRRRKPMLLLAAYGAAVIAQAGIGAFLVPFLTRIHGLEIADAGRIAAFAYGGGGLVGILMGGFVPDLIGRRFPGRELIVVAGFNATAALCAIAAMSAGSLPLALVFLAAFAIMCVAYYGPLFSTYLSLVPVSQRGLGMALMMIVANLIGYGLGPQIAGLLSDFYAGLGFTGSLRPALATTGLFYLVSAILLLMAALSLTPRDPED